MSTSPQFEQLDPFEIPAGRRRSQEAYWRDLPKLLKMWFKRGKWVAYQGDECVGIHRDPGVLYRVCHRRGIGSDQFYVGRIEPQGEPPWAIIDIESGFEGPDDDCPENPAESVL